MPVENRVGVHEIRFEAMAQAGNRHCVARWSECVRLETVRRVRETVRPLVGRLTALSFLVYPYSRTPIYRRVTSS